MELYKEITEEFANKMEEKLNNRKIMDDKWKILEEKIKESQPEYQAPALPFRSDALVSNFNKLYSSVGEKDKNMSK